MADINFNFGTEDLEQLKKILNDINKAVQKIRKQDIIGDDEATRAKALIAEQKKISNEIKKQELLTKSLEDRQEKLNQKQAESKGIIGGLESQVRQLRSAYKAANTEAEKKAAAQQLAKVNAELRKAKGATDTWGKALGSFQFKFNALGNIAGNLFKSMSNSIRRSIGEFTSFQKIIASNQLTADKYDVIMGRLRGSIEAMNRAIALGEFKNIGDEMSRAADAAADYVAAMDVLGDTQNALNIQTSRSRRVVRELEETYKNTKNDPAVRLEAAYKAQKILNDLQLTQQRIATETMNAELDRVKNTYDLTDEQIDIYKRFIENYGLLTDEQITILEGLENKTVSAIGTEKEVRKQQRLGILSATAAARTGAEVSQVFNDNIAQGNKELNDYNKTVKELSDSMGVDLSPIMTALIGTNDEQRKAVVGSIIALEDQISATQRLINRNVALVGSIEKNIKDVAELPSIMQVAVFGEEDPDTIIAEIMADYDKLQDEIIAKTIATQEEITDSVKKEAKKRFDWEAATEEEKEKKKEEIIDSAYAYLSDVTVGISQLYQAQKNKELEAAGDNAQKIDEINKKYAKKQQTMAIAEALINTAAAATRATRDVPFPASLGIIGLYAGMAAIQIATIKKQKFAAGGLVDGKPHSQGGTVIEAERGEYVINKRSTSKYKDLIEGINENNHLKILSALDKDKKVATVRSDPYTKKIYDILASKGL
jgi:hypothetical protein